MVVNEIKDPESGDEEDEEGSKSDVAMNAWPPQASYPCGNFSDTSFFKLRNKEDR